MSDEWYNRFKEDKITKVLTIESAGIALATATALKFNVPVVYAKRSIQLNYLKTLIFLKYIHTH